jgi:predicted ATP-dependent serine protease
LAAGAYFILKRELFEASGLRCPILEMDERCRNTVEEVQKVATTAGEPPTPALAGNLKGGKSGCRWVIILAERAPHRHQRRLNRVLGGSLVPAPLCSWQASPALRKAAHAANCLSRRQMKVLYVSGEESEADKNADRAPGRQPTPSSAPVS